MHGQKNILKKQLYEMHGQQNIYKKALHVSGDKLAHPQEQDLTVYTVKKYS